MFSAACTAVIIKVLGTSPLVRHELQDIPIDLDALDDATLAVLSKTALSGKAFRLLVNGRPAREVDLEHAKATRSKLVVHVQIVGHADPGCDSPVTGQGLPNSTATTPSASPPAQIPSSPAQASATLIANDKTAAEFSLRRPRELIAECRRLDLSTRTCVEKIDFVELLVAARLSGRTASTGPSAGVGTATTPSRQAGCTGRGAGQTGSDDDTGDGSSSDSSSDSDSAVSVPESISEAEPEAEASDEEPEALDAKRDEAISEAQITRWHRGKAQLFRKFVIRRPFGDSMWLVQVVIACSTIVPDCRELLERIAGRIGAKPEAPGLSEAERQAVRRLARLEARVAGKGVHEGESANALRLFERELARANWSKDAFQKMQRQLDGDEELGASDIVVEAAIRHANPEPRMRRCAWLNTACERIAPPLGLAWAHTRGKQGGWDGCCFVGPLSTAVGAALTTALVMHLGQLDYEAARSRVVRRSAAAGKKPKSRPQFLQGFVDGSLEADRARIWQRLLSLPDAAAQVCADEQRALGFFDAPSSGSRADQAHSAEVGELVSGLFGSSGGTSPPSASRPAAAARRLSIRRGTGVPNSLGPDDATPDDLYPGDFTGAEASLAEPEGEPEGEPGADSPAARPNGQRQDEFALAVAENVQTLRRAHDRNRNESSSTYNWGTRSMAPVKKTTGGESYSLGHAAGSKRQSEVHTRGKASQGATKRRKAIGWA